MELAADTADVQNMARPRNGHSLPCPTEMGCHLLGPFERRVKCPRPRVRHWRVGLLASPVFVMQQLQSLREGHEPCIGCDFWKCSFQLSFCTLAVVTPKVDKDLADEFTLLISFIASSARSVVRL